MDRWASGSKASTCGCGFEEVADQVANRRKRRLRVRRLSQSGLDGLGTSGPLTRSPTTSSSTDRAECPLYPPLRWNIAAWRVAHFSSIINNLGAPFLAFFARSGQQGSRRGCFTRPAAESSSLGPATRSPLLRLPLRRHRRGNCSSAIAPATPPAHAQPGCGECSATSRRVCGLSIR